MSRRWRALVVGAALTACAQDSISDDTARVEVGGDTTITYDLDACGVDDDTLLLLGRNAKGDMLQAVMGVTLDEEDGFVVDEDEVGLTVTNDGAVYEAFTATAWAFRGEDGAPPGEVTESTLRGSRIGISAQVDTPSGGSETVTITVDARCDGEILA